MKKFITLKFVFDSAYDEDFDDTFLNLSKVKRIDTNLSDIEINALGENIAQTDRWQIDHWNLIQSVLGNSSVKSGRAS